MTETLLAPVDNQNKNYLQELVGDGRKFKTNEDLARGKYEADSMIEVLKRQQDELRTDFLKLREQNESQAKLEDLLDRWENQTKTHPGNPPQAPDVKQPQIDLDQIRSLVSSEVKGIEEGRKASDNLNLVQSKLQERYGDKFSDVLKEQYTALGLTDADAVSMAKKSPQAFFRTFGLDQPAQTENFQTPPRSNIRTDQFAPKGAEKRTWAWYQNLKKEDPKRYYDPKTNVQMHNDALLMGESFMDGDFNA